MTRASKLLGREQECFGWVELSGKTLPVPRTNMIACSLVGVLRIVSDAQSLLVAVYKMLLRAFIRV